MVGFICSWSFLSRLYRCVYIQVLLWGNGLFSLHRRYDEVVSKVAWKKVTCSCKAAGFCCEELLLLMWKDLRPLWSCSSFLKQGAVPFTDTSCNVGFQGRDQMLQKRRIFTDLEDSLCISREIQNPFVEAEQALSLWKSRMMLWGRTQLERWRLPWSVGWPSQMLLGKR